ncbi:MAG: hypothetical protein ABJO01_07565 [Parasphingorhabdus sp.]|uniref:hypothetical protein n=1 Tax=Parasphingorhabdus sp. TaxID=2709688 RepID=UPI0032975383
MILFEREILAEFMVGYTHYLDVGGRKPVSVYFPSDKKVHLKRMDSKVVTGKMAIKDVGCSVCWHDGSNDNYNLAEHLGAFIYLDADGKSAGTITKIVPGNPEFF